MAARQEVYGQDSLDDTALRLGAEQAAAILEVGTGTLGTWEERMGCPRSSPDADGAASYSLHEVMLLRDALQTTFSLPAAAVEVRRAMLHVRAATPCAQVTRARPARRGQPSRAA